MNFERYQHVERLGHQETEGLLEGTVYVFPKIDGANGSVWWNDNKGVQCGSRNRLLSEGNDNAGFCKHVNNNENLLWLHAGFPEWRLWGEWLVPHTIKNYLDSAWRKFYVFDVTDDQGNIVHYDRYKEVLDEYNIEYVPPLAIIKNPSTDDLYRLLEKNTYLMKDGAGVGEGIVCKNYDYHNPRGNQVWGKIVTTEFKANNHKEFGVPLIHGSILIEEAIVNEFLTDDLIEKEKAKIIWSHNTDYNMENDIAPEWNNKYIPELLGRTFYEFLRDDLWDALKKHKNPTVNFRLLNNLVTKRVKQNLGLVA